MNEKIEQLAIKAGVYYHDDMYYDDHKSLQRFAELIVAECMQIIKVDMYEDAISNMWSKNKLQMIKKHFGVK